LSSANVIDEISIDVGLLVDTICIRAFSDAGRFL